MHSTEERVQEQTTLTQYPVAPQWVRCGVKRNTGGGKGCKVGGADSDSQCVTSSKVCESAWGVGGTREKKTMIDRVRRMVRAVD